MSERPGFADLLFAVRYLTVAPVPARAGGIGRASLFFPPVGLALGAVVASADALCDGGPPALRAALAVLLLAALGRWQGIRGVARLGSALPFLRDRGLALERMTGRIDLWGSGLAAVALALKLSLLWRPGPLQFWALLFAPMLSRWSLVVVAFSARQARVGTPGPRYDGDITFQEFGWASVIAAGAALVALEAVGLLALLGVAAVSIVLRLFFHRWLGGINDASLHASGEFAEIAALALFGVFKL